MVGWLAGAGVPAIVEAQEAAVRILVKAGAFKDVRQDVEDAIIAEGLKIDFNGHVAQMLERTGADIGSTRAIYKGAEYFAFCSAKLSRDALEADAANLGICPYVVFVYETAAEPGKIHIGYRRPPPAPSPASAAAIAAIDKLLDKIINAAAK
jgi:uncharacterized protein (DUF302 family)